MKLTKKSFRARVKQLFAKVFKYCGVVTNSILKKFFVDFRASSSSSWADLADTLVIMDDVMLEVAKEKSEIELVFEKYKIVISVRCDSWDAYNVYLDGKYIGELSQNVAQSWFYAFRSNGHCRKSSSLDSAVRMLINNYHSESNFAAKSKEYFDLFSS